jgi:hypothetical protein
MPSTTRTIVRQIGCAPTTFYRMTSNAIIGLAALTMMTSPAPAFVSGATDPGQRQGFWDVCP